jgi:hypothetical protein
MEVLHACIHSRTAVFPAVVSNACMCLVVAGEPSLLFRCAAVSTEAQQLTLRAYVVLSTHGCSDCWHTGTVVTDDILPIITLSRIALLMGCAVASFCLKRHAMQNLFQSNPMIM